MKINVSEKRKEIIEKLGKKIGFENRKVSDDIWSTVNSARNNGTDIRVIDVEILGFASTVIMRYLDENAIFFIDALVNEILDSMDDLVEEEEVLSNNKITLNVTNRTTREVTIYAHDIDSWRCVKGHQMEKEVMNRKCNFNSYCYIYITSKDDIDIAGLLKIGGRYSFYNTVVETKGYENIISNADFARLVDFIHDNNIKNRYEDN